MRQDARPHHHRRRRFVLLLCKGRTSENALRGKISQEKGSAILAKKFVQNNNDLAIAYYRYSSHAQSDASIEQQREAARNYANGHGLQIVKEYEDAAISGTTDQRSGFQLMLSEIGRIRPAALIIWKTDRLGRDRFDPAIAKKQIRDAGCVIHYIAEPVSGDAPEFGKNRKRYAIDPETARVRPRQTPLSIITTPAARQESTNAR